MSNVTPSLGWSCTCCTCGQLPVSIHWTFFFVWILQIVIAVIQYSDSWKNAVNVAVLWGPVLALTALLHEWGHVVRNRSFGGSCTYIVLWPLGGFSNTSISDGTCLQEFWVALCGPLMHLPQMILWMIVLALAAPNGLDYYSTNGGVPALDDGGAGIWFAQLSKGALDLNIMIFFLNLLVPAYPLDAARMLAAMSVHCGLPVLKAAYLLLIVGGLLGLGAFIYGIVALVNSSGPGIFMLFIGIFLLWTTWSLYRCIQSGQVGHHPVFQPDCYHPHNGVTNLSSASPKQVNMNRPPPKNTQNNPQKKKKKPKRNSDTSIDDSDLEMGGQPTKSKSGNKQPKKPKMKPGKVMKIQDDDKPNLHGKKVKLIKRPERTKGMWEVELLDGGKKLTVPASRLASV